MDKFFEGLMRPLARFGLGAALTAAIAAPAAAAMTTPGAAQVRELWHKRLSGYVSDLQVAPNGQALLVATLPNYEREDGARDNSLIYFDRQGHQRWQLRMPTAVKSLALSASGDLAIVSTHDDKLRAFNAAGKNIWTVEGTCKPLLMNQLKKVICYHDEDAEPQVAFDVYSFDGKKLSSVPARHDILALTLSEDERNLAIGLAKGQLSLFSPELKPRWQAEVGGEIIDLGVSRGSEPKVAVLFGRGKAQRIAIFSQRGVKIADVALEFHADQVEFSHGPEGGILVYGNGANGQILASYAVGDGLKPRWRQADPVAANYTPQMYIEGPDRVLIGFEANRADGRENQIRSYDHKGALRWSLTLHGDEDSYLYAESFAPRSSVFAAANDDGTLGVYQLGSPGENGSTLPKLRARKKARSTATGIGASAFQGKVRSLQDPTDLLSAGI